MPVLQQTELYLSLLGTKNKSILELKEAYHKLGASYYFKASDESFSMHISGIEENFEAILKLANSFIANIQLDESKVKQMLGDIKTEKKVNRRGPAYIASSLNSYVLFGNEAPRLRELTKNQLKKLTGQETNAFSYHKPLTIFTTSSARWIVP